MKLMHSIFAALLIILTAAPAHAVKPAWSASAITCVPDTLSILNQRFKRSGLIIAHQGTNVDLIQLECAINVPLPAGSQWNLVVTYRDSSGTATSAVVNTAIYRISRTSGSIGLTASFSSNSSPNLAINKGSVGFTHTFNFDTHYYVVHWLLDRTLDTQVVQAIGIAIERVTP